MDRGETAMAATKIEVKRTAAQPPAMKEACRQLNVVLHLVGCLCVHGATAHIS